MSSILGEVSLPYQLLLSFGLGTAARPALEPYVQSLSNDAWQLNAVVPPPVVLLAEGVAQGQVAKADAYSWAKQQGFDTAQMDAMVQVANTGMALGYAYESWRRGDLTDGQFDTQLHRMGIESQWWPMLEALKHDRLDLGAIATAVHRGIMSDAGLLVTPVPQGSGHIPRIPQSSLDTLAEFAAQGIDPERARVLVADTGLPLSLGEMLQLYNRGEVTATDVKVSIAESNVRNEYMDAALKLSRRLLTPHEAAEAQLRGVSIDGGPEAYAALSGVNAADFATLAELLGRPLSLHEIVTGEARGGTYGGDYSAVPAGPFRDAIRRSAIRPEYADLAYHNRYVYPSAFVLRGLAQSGDLGGTAQVQQTLEEIGWKPSFAQQVAQAWTGGGTADPHTAKAQTQLWTTTHRSYIAHEISDATATTALEAAGVASGSVPAVLNLWKIERDLIRKGLTATQIKKAYTSQTTNPDTGAAWTLQEAQARLLELGYDQANATTLLEE